MMYIYNLCVLLTLNPHAHLFSESYKMNKRLARLVSYATITTFVAGCATAGKDVPTSYVSPMQYATFDCDQLRLEGARIGGRVGELTGRLNQAANNDAAIMGAGLLLFWPALFALGGTKQQEAELSRLKGEHDALQVASTNKKCGITGSTN
jgi:hypothetical protein